MTPGPGDNQREDESDPQSHDAYPVWSPDDRRVMYDSTRNNGRDTYAKDVSRLRAEEEVLVSAEVLTSPTDWSSDWRHVLLDVDDNGYDISYLDLEGDGSLQPYLTGEANEMQGVFSPDGSWVAYASDETEQFEIYIEPFPRNPAGAGKFRITDGGGEAPRWRGDGGELFYLAPDGGIMAMPINLGQTVEWNRPVLLFRSRVRSSSGSILDAVHYDVSADGQKFVAVNSTRGSEEIRVIVNWPELLKEH